MYLNYGEIFPNTIKCDICARCDCCHISIKSKTHVCIKIKMDDKYTFHMELNS